MRTPKIKPILIISICLNVFLAAYIAVVALADSKVSTLTTHKEIVNKLCTEDYQKVLADYDKQFAGNPQMAAQAKNNFAITVCLRNYKTGQQLDLKPLADQVK